jgi:type I restriction enzyme M protein
MGATNFEQAFKNIDDVLRKDSGVATELDYIEQTSWILFLKYLNDLEEERETAAKLSGKKYDNIISPEFRWKAWAAPKDKDGKIDNNNSLTGDDLKDFVDQKLFPYLRKFSSPGDDPNTIEYKIGQIFGELKNKIVSGYRIREILEIVDTMRFRTDSEKHELSHLYESKIKNMGNAGRNGGEYYTPRPLIRTIVKVVDPKIGNKIYDGACGSAGFLVESYDYLKNDKNTTTERTKLQTQTFYGKELKSLAYIIGIMNMILHGIEAPNIVHTNTLAKNINDIQESERVDVVLANPPFGAGIGREIQQNFPIKSSETAYLFLQHFIKMLKAGGKAGIVIKNTFLSNTDNASITLRKHLLESCDLYAILDLPGGTFTGAGVRTVVLFFEKARSTQKIWYYQLNLDRNLGKTNPLSEKDLNEFISLEKDKKDSANSWTVDIKNIDQKTFDLSVKNPNKKEETEIRSPKEILVQISKTDIDTEHIIKRISKLT